MKGKTKVILTIVIAILVFTTAIVGTVTFLKDDGEASAAEEGVGNTLPVTGNDGEQKPSEGLEGEENPGQNETENSEVGTTGEGETATGTTVNQGTTVGGQTEPEATTIEQERLVSTTLNWSSISLNSTIGETGINYTNLAYTIKYYQVVNEQETNLLNIETGIAEYASTVTVTEEQITENCPEGYKLDETSELSVVITENVEANLIEVYYIKDSFNLTVNYVYENGTTAAETYTDVVEYEEEYNVESPEIVGYTADIAVVEGTMPAEDVELKVTYKPNTNTAYKVEHYLENLDGEGFTLTETENKAGTTDTEVTAEAKAFEGFTFDNTVEETVEKGIVAGDGSLVLKLYYTRNSYKVTYEYEGTVPTDATELPQEATYEYGANVTVAPEATATGYTFSGWDKADFTMPAEDVVIKGSFDINSYKVTYVYEGTVPTDASELPAEATYEYGANVTVAEEATATGYTFSGWDKADFTMPAEDVVIKGHFDINSYKVTYVYEGTVPTDATELPSEATYEYGASVTVAEEATATGYTFSGWDKADFTMPAEDVVIKGHFDINSYKVTYVYEGTVPTDATELPAEATYEYGAAVSVAANATATGYTFSGWDKADFTMPAEDVVIKGSFDINSYKVTYVYEGTVPTDATELPQEATYEYGASVTVAEEATATGYTFSGWDKADFTMPANNVVIKGHFDINSYKVTYVYEGTVPTDATELPSEATYEYGASVTVAEEATATGYTFSGWDKTDFTMPAEDVVIKGSFTVNEYTYIVEYYYENAEGEFVGPDEIASYEKSAKYQDVVTYEPKDQNGNYIFFKVETAGVEGEANLTVTEQEANNIIKVYYERNSYDYKVVYYKDSVSNANKLGETVAKEQKLKTEMTFDLVAADFGAEWINAYKSELDVPEGYQDGEVVTYITIQANDNNVINVVYKPRTDIGYTVEYYFNNVPDTTGKNYSGTETYGENIEEVTDYSNNGEWTLDTTNSTALPFTIGVANNVIKVYYVKPEITVVKTSTPSVVRDNNTVEPGETITYTITATNNGYKEGTITIADTVPTGTTLSGNITATGYDSVTPEQLAEGIVLTVPKQGTATVTFTVTVTANVNNNIVNTPTVNGEQDEDNTVTNPVEKTISVKPKVDNSTITNSNIVIVLDTSGSMDWGSEPCNEDHNHRYNGCSYDEDNYRWCTGERRLDVAKEVINGFIDNMDLPETETTDSCAVTVVEFSDIPTVIGTADTASEATTLKNNVNNFGYGGGTYMADGLVRAKAELQKLINVRPNNKNIVIFVSDGEPSSTYGLTDAANALKNVSNTTVYTVAFGSDISILKNTIATDPSKYYTTETSGTLGNIFSEVNADITGTPEDTQSTNGLIELTGVYVDDTHPIKITVNGTPLDDIKSLPTDASGKIILKDGKYYLDLSKFDAEDTVEIEYFAE